MLFCPPDWLLWWAFALNGSDNPSQTLQNHIQRKTSAQKTLTLFGTGLNGFSSRKRHTEIPCCASRLNPVWQGDEVLNPQFDPQRSMISAINNHGLPSQNQRSSTLTMSRPWNLHLGYQAMPSGCSAYAGRSYPSCKSAVWNPSLWNMCRPLPQRGVKGQAQKAWGSYSLHIHMCQLHDWSFKRAIRGASKL